MFGASRSYSSRVGVKVRAGLRASVRVSEPPGHTPPDIRVQDRAREYWLGPYGYLGIDQKLRYAVGIAYLG